MNGTAQRIGRQEFSAGAQFLRHYPVGGWQKWLFKASLVLWRMGLGF